MVCLYLLGASLGPKVQQTVSVRLARREDIPGIQSANLKTLPENYATHFYRQHMMNWPQLAFVAEATTVEDNGEYSALESVHENEGEKTVLVGRDYGIAKQPERQVVGYVLGRMDTAAPRWPSDLRYTRQGHITSLAVLPSYRRHGLAGDLMRSVQRAMVESHQAESASLHVRVSNAAALKLYGQSLGYEVKETIPSYYADGEDGYLMRNDLTTLDVVSAATPPEPAAVTVDHPADHPVNRPVEKRPEWSSTWVPSGLTSVHEAQHEPEVAQVAAGGR